MSNRDPKFLSHFWKELWGSLGTKLLFFTSYPQMDGQIKVVNMTLGPMLYVVVMDGQFEVMNRTLGSMLHIVVHEKLASWEGHFSLVKFTYNQVIHRTIGMTPFKVVYGFNPLTPIDITLFIKMLF